MYASARTRQGGDRRSLPAALKVPASVGDVGPLLVTDGLPGDAQVAINRAYQNEPMTQSRRPP
jgi:hypothetical protein